MTDTTPITLSELNTLPLVVCDFDQLHRDLDEAKINYGKASTLESMAWEAWTDACDNGKPYAAVSDLLWHAEFAEQVRKQAQTKLDSVKNTLLALQS